MGTGQSTALRWIDDEIELRRETKDFARWTLSDVKQLHVRFQKTFGLAITQSQFEDLLLLKSPETVTIKEIFEALDSNSDGRIDGLEFLASLACICRASFEDKARFAFELFDFNRNGSLSTTELALLMKSVCIGMSRLSGSSAFPLPSSSQLSSSTNSIETMSLCLRLAANAFDRYDKDDSTTLTFDEFIEWARSNREFMLQVEQFRLIADKAIGFEETLSLPDGSDVDSDLDEELESELLDKISGAAVDKAEATESRMPELAAPWMIEPTIKPTAFNENGHDRDVSRYDTPPPVNLELEWIYGVNGRTTRNACRYLTTGEIVYFISKYAIIYSSDRHSQRFYLGHQNLIQCLDVNASGEIVATGDSGSPKGQGTSQKSPEIHVWHGQTLQCLAILSNFHTSGVTHVSFPAPVSAAANTMSKSSKHALLAGVPSSLNSSLIKKHKNQTEWLLASVGNDTNASMALWDWQHVQLLASGRAQPSSSSSSASVTAKSRTNRILAMMLNEDGNEILVCGTHFILFHLREGRFFKHKKPQRMETKLQTVPICLSIAYYGPEHAVVGTSQGQLLQFHQHQLVNVVQAHASKESINVCLLSCRSMIFFTAGKDGEVKQWDSTLHPIGNTMDLHALLAPQTLSTRYSTCGLDTEDLRISSLDYDARRQRFLVVTRMGKIIEILEHSSATAAGNIEWRIVASGHNGQPISAIAMTKGTINFASCRKNSNDRSVKLWDLRRRMCTHSMKFLFAPSALAFSNNGELLAVGGNDGSIAILQGKKTLKLLVTIKNTNSSVCTLRFAPLDDIITAACLNGMIYLYKLENGGQRLTRYGLLKPEMGEKGEDKPAISLDFSMDGAVLKSQHGASVLRFWDLRQRACVRITAMYTVRDLVWQSYSSTIGWHVSGLSKNTNQKSVAGSGSIRCVNANASQNLVFSMDDSGKIAITHFPCYLLTQNQRTEWLEKSVPHAHYVDPTKQMEVNQLYGDFALHDTVLISSSGVDGVICQWRVEKELKDVQPRSVYEYNDAMRQKLALLRVDDVYFGWDPGEFVMRPTPMRTSLLQSVPIGCTTDLNNNITRTEAPDLDLSLAYVYGKNHRRSGVNQTVVGGGDAGCFAYAAGTLVVVEHIMNRKSQRVFQSGLTHSISCLVKHASQPVIAVGSREDGKLMMLNVVTQERLAVLHSTSTCNSTLITAAFDDSSGTRALAAGIWKNNSNRSYHIHYLEFYAWKQQLTVAHAQISRLPILFGFFIPTTGRIENDTNDHYVLFVSGGVNHITFWRLNTSTGHITSQQGVFGRLAVVQTLVCAVFVRPYVLTGTLDGTVILWEDAVATYTLPPVAVTASNNSGDNPNSCISLVHISSMQLVVGALRNGDLVVWRYRKQDDANKNRRKSHIFLELIRSIALFDLEWRYATPLSNAITGKSIMQEKRMGRGLFVESAYLLEESNDILLELSSGQVVHVESTLLLGENEEGYSNKTAYNTHTKHLLRVVLDHRSSINDIALHPRDFSFATGSDTGTICVWNLHTHVLKQERNVADGISIKAMGWNASGDHLAVSLGNGNICILQGQTLEMLSEFLCGRKTQNDQLPPKWCWKVVYSPHVASNAALLALACRDYNIYVYSCGNDVDNLKYELLHQFTGHTYPIEALDFSMDGKWLQSSTSSLSKELLRWSLQTQEATGSASSVCTLSDDAWSSWTNTFAGPVQGLTELYGGKVVSVSRIHDDGKLVELQNNDRSTGKWTSFLPTIAVGLENGQILLSWYPISTGDAPKMLAKEYIDYLPCDYMVTRVEFSFNNAFVVIHAKNSDNQPVVLVWKTDYEEELALVQRNLYRQSTMSIESSTQVGPDTGDFSVTATIDTEMFTESIMTKREFGNDNTGDEFLAVQPWRGAVREPSDTAITKPATLPNEHLSLEFVYGMNVNATGSNNVFYADDSWEIVYTAASIGIVYNTKTQTQLFNKSHQGNLISALAVHPKGDLVATGECGVKIHPKIVMWDANSGSTITQMERSTVHERGIRLLAFSPNGERLVSIGMEDNHLLAIYSLGQSEGMFVQLKQLMSVKTSKQLVWNVCINDDNEVVTCGDQHILFWQPISSTSAFAATGALSMKKGLFSSHKLCNARAKLQAVTYFTKHQVVSSQSDGSLYLWKDRYCIDVVPKAHIGAIPSIYVDKKTQWLYTGGSDGKICTWNAQLEKIRQLDLTQLASSSSISPPLVSTRLLSISVRDGQILFSTSGGEICEVVENHERHPTTSATLSNISDLSAYRLHVHIRGHYKGELWGLAAHPSKLQFVTAGDDGSIRLWDAPIRGLLAMQHWKAGGEPRAVAFSSDGNHIAVGNTSGQIRIWNSTLETVIAEWKCSSLGKTVQVIKYSPDCTYLVVGCHDQRIYIYDAHMYKKLGELKGHSSTVTHLDFSKDSRVLQSVAVGAGELLFWHLATLKQIPSASAVKDVQWATWTCPFGWPVKGIWPPESNGSDVNAVCRNGDSHVVATADDWGQIKLFQYPCTTSTHAPARVYLGHSSHVTNCTFTEKDMFLLTTGGLDQTICQFRYHSH